MASYNAKLTFIEKKRKKTAIELLSKCMVGCFLEEGKRKSIADRKMIQEFESNRIRDHKEEEEKEEEESNDILNEFGLHPGFLDVDMTRNFDSPLGKKHML